MEKVNEAVRAAVSGRKVGISNLMATITEQLQDMLLDGNLTLEQTTLINSTITELASLEAKIVETTKTLTDQFAMSALIGLLTNQNEGGVKQGLCETAYIYAQKAMAYRRRMYGE